jgi:hypothetical protein
MTSAGVQHKRDRWGDETGLILRALAAALLALCLPACASRESLGMTALSVVGEGVINDPANKSLRFDLLKFGLESFCDEMKRRGAPLKLRDTEPVVGRFFAQSCHTQILDEAQRQSLVLRYSGRGYGWTNITQRLGFASEGLVEYAVDFQRHEAAMYVYFRPRNVGATSFQTVLVESALAQVGMGLTGVNPDQVGRDIMLGQLQRGFTVIRYSDKGETEFGLGLIPAGQRPPRPFTIGNSEKLTLDNDRTEVHSGQQDFVGGLHVPAGGGSITLTLSIDGAPGIDVFVIRDTEGGGMFQAYVTQAGPSRLTQAPSFEAVLAPGAPQRFELKLPAGGYYLVFDHSNAVGRAAPPDPRFGDRAARVDYLVQLE